MVEPITQQRKENMFLVRENQYVADQADFSKIPGSPVAYWVSQNIFNLFTKKSVRDYAEPRHGMSTGNNDLCLKMWFEIDNNNIYWDAGNLNEFDDSKCKYTPYKKGGSFRLWYGNNDYVIAFT